MPQLLMPRQFWWKFPGPATAHAESLQIVTRFSSLVVRETTTSVGRAQREFRRASESTDLLSFEVQPSPG